MNRIRPPGRQGLYNEFQFCGKLYGLNQKGGTYVLVDILVPIFVEKIPWGRNGGDHHILVPP
jgi:hypothetical protein